MRNEYGKWNFAVLGAWLAGASAQAAYEVKTELEVSGSPIQHGVVTVDDSRPATLSFGELSVRISTDSDHFGAVLLKSEIARTVNERRVVLARPQMLTLLGQTAEVRESTRGGQKTVRLKLTPREIP